jgi:hypothetical protein
LGVGHTTATLDLIIAIDGVSFDQAWQNRSSGTLDSLPVNFISQEDLIANKLAAAREKDLLDDKILRKMQNKPA